MLNADVNLDHSIPDYSALPAHSTGLIRTTPIIVNSNLEMI